MYLRRRSCTELSHTATEPLLLHIIKYDYEYQFHNQNFHLFPQTADNLLTSR